MSTKVALVTGASSGIGEATALRLHELGYTVHAAARRVERMNRLAERGIRPLAMDVTDDASLRGGVERIVAGSGRIDVLVNNAGYGSFGALEDVPLSEARRQFEVNVFGAARLTQLVLPHMRTQRAGRIVNVSSVGGKVYTPLGSWYHATKHALEGLSDCLRVEVAPFGVHVVLIEPGGIKTEWGAIAADHLLKASRDGAYADRAAVIASAMSPAGDPRGSEPSVVADAIAKAVTARRPKIRYVMGLGARPAILARRILPDRAMDAVVNLALRSAAR